MSGAALPVSFYARPTPEVARSLLGHILESAVSGRRVAGRIVETEAYIGPHDPACHGYGARRTQRNSSLFGQPGTAYVYFTYGMHWCLNAVTESEGYPAAVLIRALEPILGLETMRRRRAARGGRGGRGGRGERGGRTGLGRERSAVRDEELCSGPAKLCEALGVTRRLDGVSLQRGVLRIVKPPSPRGFDIIVTPRIGITRAADWPLRFLIKDSPWVSQRPSLTPSFAPPRL